MATRHPGVTLARSGIEVFAVEDRSVQLSWSALAAPRCTFGVGGHEVDVVAGPPATLHRERRGPTPLATLPWGPGTVTVDGLEPGTAYEVWVSTAPGARRSLGRITTLAGPPGKVLSRFATFADPHVGEGRFGALGRIVEGPEIRGRSAALCLEAAVAEAVAWGAELLICRGDVTRRSHPQEFAAAAEILGSAGVPALAVLGNHDVRHRVDGAPILAAGGVRTCTDTLAVDLEGLRLVLGHSPMTTEHRGDLPEDRIAELARLCHEAPPRPDGRPGPAAVVLHHPLSDRRRLSPYPPGVPVEQSDRLGAALLDANRATIVLAGHRHRTRRRTISGVTVSEVGSTKDYPGVWAGYAVHEGGVRQVVRRVADPVALRWTEATGRAVGGLWSRWSPGSIEDRCWIQRW